MWHILYCGRKHTVDKVREVRRPSMGLILACSCDVFVGQVLVECHVILQTLRLIYFFRL